VKMQRKSQGKKAAVTNCFLQEEATAGWQRAVACMGGTGAQGGGCSVESSWCTDPESLSACWL
jgi:hypothetical protein